MGAVSSLNQSDRGTGIDALAKNSISAKGPNSRQKPFIGAYVALLLFMFIYCARPEDWIPGLSNVPLAKITGILILLTLVFSLRQVRRPVPRETLYLLFLVAQLLLASLLSPVWRSGAVQVTLDFAKVLIIAILMAAALITLKRLRLLLLIQVVSVAVISAGTVLKGHLLVGRLDGTVGGNYSDPNDMALAIVMSLPLCLTLVLLSRGRVLRATLISAMLVMAYAVILTGSRGGFFALIVAVVFCLWDFGIRGRRRYLFVLTVAAAGILWLSSSAMLVGRLKGTFDRNEDTAAAYSSAQQRRQLFWRSIEVTEEHPLFGIGPGNFPAVSGSWHVTHNSFTQMSSEGGVTAFILYGLILWGGFKNLRATKQFARGQRESILLSRALHASLAGYIVGSLFLSDAYQFLSYFVVAESAALLWITKKSISRSGEQEPLRQSAWENVTCPDVRDTDNEWSSHPR